MLDATGQNRIASVGDAPKRPAQSSPRDPKLEAQAKAFETAFVAQMLKFSGLEKTVSANSGYGGEAFASFMIEAMSERLVEQQSFGLADTVYEQLARGVTGNGER